MSEPTAAIWKEFRAECQEANVRLVAEIESAARDLRSLIGRLGKQVTSTPTNDIQPGKAASLERLFGEMERDLFESPVGAFERLGSIERTLSAMERHRLELDNFVRRLPFSVLVSGPELLEAVGDDARGIWRKTWLRWRKAPRRVKLQSIVRANLQEQLGRRTGIDANFELLLARAGLHLVAAWQAYRRSQLAILAGGDRDRSSLAAEWKWWARTAKSLDRRLDRAVRSYRYWAGAFPGRLGAAVLRGKPELSLRRQSVIADRWEVSLGQCHRQGRALRAVIALERGLSTVAHEAIQATRQSLESLGLEHEDVARELDQAIGWLGNYQPQNSSETLPVPKAVLLPAEHRARDWLDRISSCCRMSIPAVAEVLRPPLTFPGRGKPWRQAQPQRVVLDALKRSGADAARDAFRAAETEHISVIRDLEQVRQVLKFAAEAGRAEGATGNELSREAAANSVALLQHRGAILVDPKPGTESGLCRAEALVLLQAHTALEVGRLGLLALLTRQGTPRAMEALGRRVRGIIRETARSLQEFAAKVVRWVAAKLGWETEAPPRLEPLVRRTPLSAVLEVQLRTRELPALYQRLFSLAPVEDERFLVGREVEMGGLGQAFASWENGAKVMVLLVGARGSGKTSLLNCAASTFVGSATVARGQFRGRIRSSEQMSEFLRELFRIPPGTDLKESLKQERRVAIIEEFERTFLRSMNGFDTLRDFLRLMADTSRSTLWILSMNQASFDYLDAVLGLGQNFSHRINAMSVSQEQMTSAILERHRLSGLRLKFAPSLSGVPGVKGMQRFLGLEQSPQQLFFDALYRQSEGLFRAAFELWLGSIERIEGGLLRMLQPLDPGYGRLEAQLNEDDLFTLQAILQHSCLLPEDVAEVFSFGIEEARSRLERLQELEIVEPEPDSPEFRIRPQAGRFVRDALGRQNLL